MDPDFPGTDQSWISDNLSVNRMYIYMYAVARPTEVGGLGASTLGTAILWA